VADAADRQRRTGRAVSVDPGWTLLAVFGFLFVFFWALRRSGFGARTTE
jgi:hypothetical protein